MGLFFGGCFGGHHFFLSGTDTPVVNFWEHLPWVSKLGWISSLVCFITCKQWNPHIHLWYDTCWPFGDQYGSQAIPIQGLVNKHWWGSSPGSVMPLPHSMRRSTNWAMPARLLALMLEYGFRNHTKALTLILTFGLSIPYRLKYTKLFILISTLSPASVVIPLMFSYCSTFITKERPHCEPVHLEKMMLNERSCITNYPIKKVNVCIVTIWRVHYKIDVKCSILGSFYIPYLPCRNLVWSLNNKWHLILRISI